MDRQVVQKIIEAGAQAPSGSNSQPWRFEVRGDEIIVYGFPEKDHPVLNVKNRGTWLAHGALVENISVAAEKFGYRAYARIFPYGANKKITASVTLTSGTGSKDTLYDAIFKRVTNRKPYSKEPLRRGDRAVIENAFRDVDAKGVRAYFTESSEDMKKLGEAVSVNEIVMFENPTLNNLMFGEIVWTEKEERSRGGGLYVKTMELKPPQVLVLKLMKYRPVMKILTVLKATRGIASANAKIYASSSLMGIVVAEDDDTSFLEAGRALERIWLQATAEDMSFHLITGIFFLWQRLKESGPKNFSSDHVALVKSAYEKVASVFGVKNGIIASLFRTGYDGEPSARSIKKPPEIIYS